VNQNCSSPIPVTYIAAAILRRLLTAPYGFSGYRWFNSDFFKDPWQWQNLSFSPTPPAGTVYAVEITPYPEQGCIDTVYTTIKILGSNP